MGSLSITLGHEFLIHNRKHIAVYLYTTKLIPCFRFSSGLFCEQGRLFFPCTWIIAYQNCISPSLRDSEDGHARYRAWEKNAVELSSSESAVHLFNVSQIHSAVRLDMKKTLCLLPDQIHRNQ